MNIEKKGSAFWKCIEFENTTWDDCEQIVILIYRKSKNDNKIYFVKNEDVKYQNAKLIEKNIDSDNIINIYFDEDLTSAMDAGIYTIEIERKLQGQKTPVILISTTIFELQKTLIN